jgi:cobalt/nickel transport protein
MKKQNKFIIAGFATSLFLAGVVSNYASSSPDGLEKVAQDIGFLENAKESKNADGLLADYGVKGVENERLSTGAAGVIGVVGLFVFVPGLSKVAFSIESAPVANYRYPPLCQSRGTVIGCAHRRESGRRAGTGANQPASL